MLSLNINDDSYQTIILTYANIEINIISNITVNQNITFKKQDLIINVIIDETNNVTIQNEEFFKDYLISGVDNVPFTKSNIELKFNNIEEHPTENEKYIFYFSINYITNAPCFSKETLNKILANIKHNNFIVLSNARFNKKMIHCNITNFGTVKFVNSTIPKFYCYNFWNNRIYK